MQSQRMSERTRVKDEEVGEHALPIVAAMNVQTSADVAGGVTPSCGGPYTLRGGLLPRHRRWGE